MKATSLKDYVTALPRDAFEEVLRLSTPSTLKLTGLVGSTPALVIAKTFLESNRPILVLCHTPKAAENMQADLSGFLGEDSANLFPQREATPYDGHSPFGHTLELRFEAQSRALAKPSVTVATVLSFAQKIVPCRDFRNNTIRLEEYQNVDLGQLRGWLVQMGFTHVPLVEEIGQFSVRGGILDVFPLMAEQPVRIELWGDDIESIRDFDVFTQRSGDPRKTVEILPMREFLLTREEREEGIEALGEAHGRSEAWKDLERRVLHEESDDGIEWSIGWFKDQFESVLDYLGKDVMIFEIGSQQTWAGRHADNRAVYEQNFAKARSHGFSVYSSPDDLLWSRQELERKMASFPRVEIGFLDQTGSGIHFRVREQPRYLSGVSSFLEDLKKLTSEGIDVSILCDNPAQAQRLQELLEKDADAVNLIVGNMAQGFVIEDLRSALFTDHQIFNRYARKIRYRKYKGGVSIPSLEALTPGDFVVHEDHGIGRFKGIERVKAGEGERDCMLLLFSDNDKLHTPVESFEKIQKYVGKDGTPPVLSRLGSKSWEKTKARTKKAIERIAQDLLNLYAERKYRPGHSFTPDTHWQKEFEDAFIYEETPDQEKAIVDIKKDMESPHPMDRLICGDVGFGKTEVAVRAAFKAVMEGKQVAILVPTTVLAAQHLLTLRERMADFPVQVGMLSRFVTSAERKRTVERLKQGQVDIVVGTHRLLSKDIAFKDLGLLVVDEEHRFGVRHKEKIKQVRHSLDVISMTATPIPRTLHMSMVGARDISLINTPPLNRLPVQTRVMKFDEETVAQAIRAEISREGQVYFVHNRIQTIAAISEMVERLVPEARVAVGHGQMNERDLEKTMQDFMDGHFDVLVSTTIIESGLDIPNVNTLIVHRSDMFGLADLYQLRGRVGRSATQAYAYLTVPSFGGLKADAVRRLKTLEQFTDLGSGFQIAMRDMEIRGAGNLLGTEQHGFIAAVGFEMYMRLLRETMQEMRGETVEKTIEPKIDVDAEAYLPEEYVEDGEQRIAIYRKISEKETLEELAEVTGELRDRFGDPPRPVRSLLAIMTMKLIAKKLYLGQVRLKHDRLVLEFADGFEPDPRQIGIITERITRPFEFLYSTPLRISVELSETQPFLKLQQAQRTLEKMLPSQNPAQ